MPCKPREKIKPRQYFQTKEDILRNMRWYVIRYLSLILKGKV